MNQLKRASALVVLVIVCANVFLSGAATAAKQTEGSFPVHVIQCDAFVEAQNSAAGFGIPPECAGIEGVRVYAYSTNSEPLDDCVTDAEGFCFLNISLNGTHIFRQDVRDIPDGYVSWENTIHEFTYTEFAEIWFHNYLEYVLPQRDAPRATVRVNTRVCPEKYTGDTFFDDCDPTLPEHEQWVFANDQIANAGADGNAVLEGVPAATASRIISGYDLSTGDVFFYCSLTSDPETQVSTSLEVTAQYDGLTRDFSGIIALEPGMDVTCDWYQIPLLDRGLWDTLVSPLAGQDASVTFPIPAGDIALTMKRCPVGYIPETISGARDTCTTPENGATVRATSESGTEFDSSTTSAQGITTISMSQMTVDSWWITLDGHANAEPDLVACYANGVPGGESGDLIQQWVTFDGAGWTVNGFGDDGQGYTCDWYLVPTNQ